jgi:hypothetical protein
MERHRHHLPIMSLFYAFSELDNHGMARPLVADERRRPTDIY